jgi:phospholysine phosphohistidine inorganic pyrophosphate phosphatase
MQEGMEGIRGALIDVDGTLLLGDAAIPGAAAALTRLRQRGLPFLLTTNTTRRSRAEVAHALTRAGVPAAAEEVVAPSALASRLIVRSGRTRALLLVPPGALADFEGIERAERDPHWVVVADLGPGFTFERLNHAFRCLHQGASLLALHRNPWWLAGEDDPRMDAGAFVAALEYASGVPAVNVGKPSRDFFDLALGQLGLRPEEVLVVGDDLENDAEGGRAAGCRTALVRTGKPTEAGLARSARPPDLVVDSIADLW